MPAPDLIFITGNANKLAEVNRYMANHDLDFKFENIKLDLPELQGEPEEISKEKCLEAFNLVRTERVRVSCDSHSCVV